MSATSVQLRFKPRNRAFTSSRVIARRFEFLNLGSYPGVILLLEILTLHAHTTLSRSRHLLSSVYRSRHIMADEYVEVALIALMREDGLLGDLNVIDLFDHAPDPFPFEIV